MATLTITTLGPTFWALLATLGICGAATVLTAIVRRRYEEDGSASIDHLHVHCFPLDKKLERKCLICGARPEDSGPAVVALPIRAQHHHDSPKTHMPKPNRRTNLKVVPRLD